MKKTKAKVVEVIEKRRQLKNKELSLKGEDVFSCSLFPDKHFPCHYTDTEVCEDPVKIIRLRSPEYETGEHFEISDGIPVLKCVMKDSGFLDADGYLHLRIKPDAPKDLIHYFIDKNLECFSNYPLPQEDARKKNRSRLDEKIKALEVWELRSLNKTYPEIAKMLHINTSTIRKMWCKAHEILIGKKYDPADYKKPDIKKTDSKKTCETCNDYLTCEKSCPDVDIYANQDYVSLRESLTDDITNVIPNRNRKRQVNRIFSPFT